MKMNEKRIPKEDEIRQEYDFSRGVRGKYARQFSQASNVVVLEPDVSEKFRSAKAVNEALRTYLDTKRTEKHGGRQINQKRQKNVPHRKNTSQVEVTNVSSSGLRLLVSGRELFLPFEKFPWLRDASIGALLNVQHPHPGHLYWPELDVDLDTGSIEDPDRSPLVSKPALASKGKKKSAGHLARSSRR